MTAYPLSTIATILGSAFAHKEDPMIDILLTDSRSLTYPERTLFFAIVTHKGNGHDYIETLYRQGVRSFVISQGKYGDSCPEAFFIRVPSALEALQKIAKTHRSSLTIPVVGITGSNGKTTLKEILYQLLHHRIRVGRSPKSYNSSIGVPLSLWSIEQTDEIALIEAGISKPDEMKVLEGMITPNIGIITNIGEAHQENFVSLQQKCIEKLHLFAHSDTIICSADDTVIQEGLKTLRLSEKVFAWSMTNKSAPVFVHGVERGKEETLLKLSILGQERKYKVPYTDEGSIHDVLLAITFLAKVYPNILEEAEAFSHLEPISMRLEVIEGNGDMMLINDTYNSDFDSFRIALDYMTRRNTEGKTMVLMVSDIYESGTHPSVLYQRMADLVSRHHISEVYAIGEELARYASLFKVPTTCYRTTDDLISALRHTQLEGKVILLKGARSARFEKIVQTLERHTHQTILDVNLSNIIHNFNYYKNLLPHGTRIVCMVKAFGYGTGSYEIARTLMEQRCDYLAVAVVDEGKALRDKGIDMPIIVMNPERSAFARMIEYRLQPEIYSLQLLKDFIKVADNIGEHHYPIHLKWDTGMHRMGLRMEMVDQLLELLRDTSAVRVASVFTHLAVADDQSEDIFTLGQLNKIKEISAQLSAKVPYPFYTHALNTAGITRFADHAMDMVRLGIGLYGISPLGESAEGLRPVAGLRTIILQVQEVPAGETIGYGRRGKVSRPSRIAIIPIGYADGIDRRLGNGNLTMRTADGTLVPTIGNICMDTLMLDVTDAPMAVEGSEITVFDETLPVERLSDAIGTIPYEILSRLSPRVARRYFNE
ncbi:bifunctional UDP-N-acetylmuramoyl-tripeptide:D-alanyl-D-alanine ligase/alanine racemase [Porphyromonas sp.]|uniref:bifunctional UDP-N-acetylmuramoyl-tripeptide:D-alanyl-D-alanine ligase/alanine racemase n=1 Tax=Porphyromonas sp. TaxID=1924944 RepID=UPI0026DAC639|nr:bifunctional UDP-N-acetylmuramoyl-tripeptide:D-alanyl-D-alanine ligase/alanine racemase [Porphyromonas sp.]MDO4770862.1 bifunctional UDP-N-acetylmuramoyl-tripeptide:D-alanyl-D-alanine ligase/alanine racemase [Porphyromonas sp.]